MGARNERHICAVVANKTSGFEVIHGLLDRIMQLLEITYDKEKGYFLQGTEGRIFVNVYLILFIILYLVLFLIVEF